MKKNILYIVLLSILCIFSNSLQCYSVKEAKRHFTIVGKTAFGLTSATLSFLAAYRFKNCSDKISAGETIDNSIWFAASTYITYSLLKSAYNNYKHKPESDKRYFLAHLGQYMKAFTKMGIGSLWFGTSILTSLSYTLNFLEKNDIPNYKAVLKGLGLSTASLIIAHGLIKSGYNDIPCSESNSTIIPQH